MRFPRYEAAKANFRAVRTRRTIVRVYKRNPGKAIEHVNAKLDEANRAEYEREIKHLPAMV
jgi:hypothetical protein